MCTEVKRPEYDSIWCSSISKAIRSSLSSIILPYIIAYTHLRSTPHIRPKLTWLGFRIASNYTDWLEALVLSKEVRQAVAVPAMSTREDTKPPPSGAEEAWN